MKSWPQIIEEQMSKEIEEVEDQKFLDLLDSAVKEVNKNNEQFMSDEKEGKERFMVNLSFDAENMEEARYLITSVLNWVNKIPSIETEFALEKIIAFKDVMIPFVSEHSNKMSREDADTKFLKSGLSPVKTKITHFSLHDEHGNTLASQKVDEQLSALNLQPETIPTTQTSFDFGNGQFKIGDTVNWYDESFLIPKRTGIVHSLFELQGRDGQITHKVDVICTDVKSGTRTVTLPASEVVPERNWKRIK